MKYKREPIIIDSHTIMLIHLFTRTDKLEDLWITDIDGYEEVRLGDFKRSADQLLHQLEDNCAPAFLMYLRDAITEKLKTHDKKYGTEFATTKKKCYG